MSAGEPRPDPLDRDGEWEIRATIYRNGRRVAICDTTGHESYDSAAYWIGEGLVTREVEFPTVVETLNGSEADAGEQETGHKCEPYYSRAECGQCGWQEQWCVTCSRQMCGCATDAMGADQ